MALDPSISLQAQAPAPLDVSKWANLAKLGTDIAQSQATTANLRASNPGIQALSEKQQAETEVYKNTVEAAKNAIETDPQTGNPIIDPATNTAKINPAKYVFNLFKAGNGAEALKAQHDQITNEQENAKLTGQVVDMNNSVRNTLALAAKAAYDNAPGTPEQKTAAAQSAWEDLAGKAVASSAKSGKPLDPSQFTYTPGIEHTLYTAQITPGAQESLKISQGQLAQGWGQLNLNKGQFEQSQKLNFTTPADGDPNSPSSVFARQLVKNATGQDVPATETATSLYANPATKGILGSVGAAAGLQLSEAKKTANYYHTVDSALDAAKDDLAKSGFTPANFLENWSKGKITSTPSLAALAGVLSQNPNGPIALGQTFDSAKAVTKVLAEQADSNVKSAGGGAAPATPTKPGSVPGKPAPKQTFNMDVVRQIAAERGMTEAQVIQELEKRQAGVR